MGRFRSQRFRSFTTTKKIKSLSPISCMKNKLRPSSEKELLELLLLEVNSKEEFVYLQEELALLNLCLSNERRCALKWNF